MLACLSDWGDDTTTDAITTISFDERKLLLVSRGLRSAADISLKEKRMRDSKPEPCLGRFWPPNLGRDRLAT